MNTLILGDTGFVGQNLKKKIKGHFFKTPKTTGYDLTKDSPIIDEFFQLSQPEIIFNLASHGGSLKYVSTHHADIINDNLLMTLNLYKTASCLENPPTIINPISNCSYPGHSSLQQEYDWLNGDVHESVYSFGNSKRAIYQIAKCYEKQYGIRTINLIFPNAFGIYDHLDPNKTHALSGMILRMLKCKQNNEKTFEVWGTGNPIREWIYSEDFADILLASVDKIPQDVDLVNIAQGKGWKIKESAALIKKLIKYEGEIVFNTEYPDGDLVKVLDDTKFKSIFGNYPFLDHEEALSRTIDYYQAHI